MREQIGEIGQGLDNCSKEQKKEIRGFYQTSPIAVVGVLQS